MEGLAINAQLVQCCAQNLVSEGEIPPKPGAKGFGGGAKKTRSFSDEVKPPVQPGKNYQLECESGDACNPTGWYRGHWRALSPLAAPVAAPMEWDEPVLVG